MPRDSVSAVVRVMPVLSALHALMLARINDRPTPVAFFMALVSRESILRSPGQRAIHRRGNVTRGLAGRTIGAWLSREPTLCVSVPGPTG